MAWNIYRRDTGAVIVREEDEEIKGASVSFTRPPRARWMTKGSDVRLREGRQSASPTYDGVHPRKDG
jgi:hypothetical protein